MPGPSRRDTLRATAALTMAAALPATGCATAAAAPRSAAAAATTSTAATARSVAPFPLQDVQLDRSLFTAKRDLMLEYARTYPADRILSIFRANAGLDTKGAQPVGGWESPDGQANGNLRGHYAGHFLSMLSQAYASSAEHRIKDKLDYIVTGLSECQQALASYAPTFERPGGRFGRCVHLQGTTEQHIALPPGILSSASGFTLTMWVRLDHLARWSRLADCGTGMSRYLFLTPDAGNGRPRFALTTDAAGGEQKIDGDRPLPVEQWCHIAVTVDPGRTTGVLYLDGREIGRNTSMTLTPADLGATEENWIGRSRYVADPYLRAAVDDVHFYDRALSPTQITELTTSPGSGNLAAYALDEGGGETVRDSSGRGAHARLVAMQRPSHPGYLAAYPETQFILLESFHSYPEVWAPYYTCHKIMRGLLDAHTHAGNAQALHIADRMGDWVHSRLSQCSHEQLQKMWSIFSGGEFGGMAEVLVDLAELTGRDRHGRTARLFDLDSFIDACAENRDTLQGRHANQHIPMFHGFLRQYETTGEARYLSAARNFWPMVVPHRMYSHGGTSRSEFWAAPDVIAGSLHPKNAETCATYNMLKLSRMLFFHQQDPAYLEYYERGLFDHILASRQDEHSTESPLVTYFVGMSPGAVREFGNIGTCCGGTGMENHTKYQDTVYFRSEDEQALYVNLFIPSTVSWRERGFEVSQETGFPYEEGTKLTVNGRGRLALKIRYPRWARKGISVRVNGGPLKIDARPGEYLTIERHWEPGDSVRITMPFTLRTESTPDDPGVQSLFYGPLLLVGRDASTALREMSLYGQARLSGDLRDAARPAGTPMHYTLDGRTYAPFHEGTENAYHAYFQRTEPRVVFAGRDSGVRNPAHADGTTFLDDLWSQAPFTNRSAFREAVAQTTRTWADSGRFSAAERDAVIDTARRAPMKP